MTQPYLLPGKAAPGPELLLELNLDATSRDTFLLPPREGKLDPRPRIRL